jgi:glucose-6-phosphate dehydrogenase assembly protein OpcA
VSEHVWSAQDTSPGEIDEALRELLRLRHEDNPGFVPARVLNLVTIVDREWRGEIENRLQRVGRFHPSRTILCAVEPRRKTIDAWVSLGSEDVEEGQFSLGFERIIIECGPDHLRHLNTVVDPLVVVDLATVVWSPHHHPEAVDALLHLAQVVLVDSIEEPSMEDGVNRAGELSEKAYVVDLAWLRSTPWRERVSATFDPPQLRPELWSISSVTARHRPDSAASGLFFFGWLASRLGWKPGSVIHQGGSVHGNAKAGRHEVKLKLEPDETMSAPGLAGVTIETAGGTSISLNRGPGGLTAVRRDRKGKEAQWTIMGASRGEAGILGEGIRQALLRDPTYRPALEQAEAMLG